MLFVSCNVNLMIFGIRAPQPEYHPTTGELVREKPGINAQFTHGGVTNWAAEQALAYPPFQSHWNGLPDGVDRRAYISSYDTDFEAERHGWSDDEKRFVEDVLLKHSSYGRRFIRLESAEEQQIAPWPNYENTHWKQVVRVAQDIGADLGYVLEYEKAHGNRPAVVAGLEEAVGAPVELVEA